MLNHTKFAQLRLSQFAPAEDIALLENWEFHDRLWVGEAIGFSEWLRPKRQPNTLQSLSLDFESLPASLVRAVLTALNLPLSKGMTYKKLTSVLGEPVASHQFISDRMSYEFHLTGDDAYTIFCTVKKRGGLTYLVVTVPHKRRGRA
jgi:hypothetical protein